MVQCGNRWLVGSWCPQIRQGPVDSQLYPHSQARFELGQMCRRILSVKTFARATIVVAVAAVLGGVAWRKPKALSASTRSGRVRVTGHAGDPDTAQHDLKLG